MFPKMTKIVSHVQALFRKSNDYVGEFDPLYEMAVTEVSAEKGRVVKKTVVKTIDAREEMAKYDANDFRLENLMAVGALHDEKRFTYSPSTMDMMDVVNGGYEHITDIDAALAADNNNDNKDVE